ncbi:MAG: SDR family oxidoreductase [Magnetococcales bacterium]|nr:SDR family oxidoreductase [Magnetococcales bacterium]MBF0155673.1 SDR family oxidoreductase [Magnetococcales bacterium]
MELSGATALVTGSGRRIGAALALSLAAQGVRVVLHAHRAKGACREIADTIRSRGGEAWPLEADLTVAAEAIALFENARRVAHAPISILVNSAAMFEVGSLRDTSLTAWQRHLDLNLTAPFLLTGAFARQAEMLPSAARDAAGLPLGKVVNIIDRRVTRPTPGHLAYTTAKSALWTLTRISARELAPTIHVNALGPGPILPATDADGESFRRVAAATPAGRAGSPGELAEALIFLLRHDYIVGELLCVDGGEHL